MKRKRFLSIIISLTMLFSSFFIVTSNVFAQDNPVKLLFSKATLHYGSEVGCDFSGYVEVENLAYNKQITICYSDSNSPNDIKTVSAKYVGPADGSREVWYFDTFIPYNTYKGRIIINHFVKYTVNGVTYIDNNSGSSYSLGWGYDPGIPGIVLSKSVVVLDQAYSNETTFSGSIQLKNLNYSQDVKVRYTTDNWATYKEVNASYSNKIYSTNIECWNFTTTIPANTQLKFAISYTTNGITYWDNNFKKNYTLDPSGTVTTRQ